MPKSKSTARKTRKKSYRRKVSPIVNISRGPTGFPESMETRVNYSQTYASGNIAYNGCDDYLFRLNSVYDPDYSGTGHQPMGRDEYTTLYSKYKVISTHVSVAYSYISPYGMVSAIIPNGDVNPLTTLTKALEMPHTTMKICNGNCPDVKLSKTFSLPELCGVTRTRYMSDDIYGAVSSNNPPEDIILHVVTSSPGAPLSWNYTFTIKLTYRVIFYDPVPLGQS